MPLRLRDEGATVLHVTCDETHLFLCVSLWKHINAICTITCMAFILILSLKLLLSYLRYFAVVRFIDYDNT